jgi:tetraacyldisaccharide 4'-kinase
MTISPKTVKNMFSLKDLGLKQTDLQDIISGQYQGAYAAFLKIVSCPLSAVYRFIVQTRNRLYDVGLLKTHSVSVPVISVGNITAGGTGKTPLVAWLAKYISSKKNCAILTRGYKANQGISDEVSILARSAPNTPVVVNPDRLAGAKEAIGSGAEVLVLDDGFQHRRLARNVDIVTIDATCPFGYDQILPAGLLREPLKSLKRADAVIITRTDQAEKNRIEEIEITVKAINPSLIIATAIHKPLCIRDSRAVELQPVQLKGKRVFAFCGIGNPDAFLTTLKSLGATIAGSTVFDDHYHYTKADVDRIAGDAKAVNADSVLTTEKDFSKINAALLTQTPLDFAYLAVEIELLAGAERITQLIDKAIAGKISTSI